MSAREDTVDVEAIRAWHVDSAETVGPDLQEIGFRRICLGCNVPWPCNMIRVLDALAASEAARQEAEAALRDVGRCNISFGAQRRIAKALNRLTALDSGHQESAPSRLEGERE